MVDGKNVYMITCPCRTKGGKEVPNTQVKTVQTELDRETHMKLKIKTTMKGENIKDYVAELIKKDLEEGEEDHK